MTDSACMHQDLEFSPDMVENETPGGVFRFVTVRVRCAGCRLNFHWRGIESGHPNADEPTVSADGFELRAPILPGPGSIVGLMVATGLEDKLVNPTKEERNGTG